MLAASQLRGLLDTQAARPGEVVNLRSTDAAGGGSLAAGPLARLIEDSGVAASQLSPSGQLPFALDGRPTDIQEAERRLACELRRESADKDALMARWVDRRLSWRISFAPRADRDHAQPGYARQHGFRIGERVDVQLSGLLAAPDCGADVPGLDHVRRRRRRAGAAQDDRVAFRRAARRDDRQPGARRGLRRHHDRDAIGRAAAGPTSTCSPSCWSASGCARSRPGARRA